VFNSEEILRSIGKLVREYGLKYIYSAKEYRGDNAAIIGLVGYYKILSGEILEGADGVKKIDREPRLSL
jgi:tRNA A37 threonylcarbamoyltransferase TsaD